MNEGRSGARASEQVAAGGVALFARATRLPFLTATLVPVLVGTAVAAWEGSFHLLRFVLALLGAACFHVGTNVANDYFDHLSGADEANPTPTPFSGGSRVIQQGLVGPHRMALLSAVFFLLGVGFGLTLVVLLWPAGVHLVWMGIAGLSIGVFYTSPPLRLVHRGLGEVAVGVGFGPLVAMGAYFVQTLGFGWTPLVASLPVGLLIAAVLYINEFPDRDGDARAGKRTLVVRLPERMAVAGYAAFPALAYAIIVAAVAAGRFPAWTLLALATMPLAIRAARVLRREHRDPYRLVPANAMTVALHFATGMLLFAGFAIAAWSG